MKTVKGLTQQHKLNIAMQSKTLIKSYFYIKYITQMKKAEMIASLSCMTRKQHLTSSATNTCATIAKT